MDVHSQPVVSSRRTVRGCGLRSRHEREKPSTAPRRLPLVASSNSRNMSLTVSFMASETPPHSWSAEVLRQPLNCGWAISTAGPVVLRFRDMSRSVGACGSHVDAAILVVRVESGDLIRTLLSVKCDPRTVMVPSIGDCFGNVSTAIEVIAIQQAVELAKETSSWDRLTPQAALRP